MRADALWEVKRRRDNLREQSHLLHPELSAPDWLSGPHPPLWVSPVGKHGAVSDDVTLRGRDVTFS